MFCTFCLAVPPPTTSSPAALGASTQTWAAVRSAMPRRMERIVKPREPPAARLPSSSPTSWLNSTYGYALPGRTEALREAEACGVSLAFGFRTPPAVSVGHCPMTNVKHSSLPDPNQPPL